MTDAMLRMQDVWKHFGSHAALKGLNLAVPEGSAYALIGANGAGKTTTIKLALNMIAPTSGAAEILGIDTRRLGPALLTQIGYVSESQALPQRMRVGDYLGYLRPYYPTWDGDLETSMVRRLQLPLGRRIGDLSHGMRIKVALACALPYRPKLLILDEPFSGLDALVRDEFMEGSAHAGRRDDDPDLIARACGDRARHDTCGIHRRRQDVAGGLDDRPQRADP